MSGSHSRPEPRTDRRQFLTSAASLAATAAAAAYFPWTRSTFANLSPNDRPRIGCIGVGGMGRGDAHEHKHFGDILAICDVDKEHADKVNAEEAVASGKADVYGDYRKVLERSDIDVVSIVTPDHWHVKIAIEALQAGKHVFCQKPLTLTLEENQLIRNAWPCSSGQVTVCSPACHDPYNRSHPCRVRRKIGIRTIKPAENAFKVLAFRQFLHLKTVKRRK